MLKKEEIENLLSEKDASNLAVFYTLLQTLLEQERENHSAHPDICRCLSIAITELETSSMYADKALAAVDALPVE